MLPRSPGNRPYGPAGQLLGCPAHSLNCCTSSTFQLQGDQLSPGVLQRKHNQCQGSRVGAGLALWVFMAPVFCAPGSSVHTQTTEHRVVFTADQSSSQWPFQGQCGHRRSEFLSNYKVGVCGKGTEGLSDVPAESPLILEKLFSGIRCWLPASFLCHADVKRTLQFN